MTKVWLLSSYQKQQVFTKNTNHLKNKVFKQTKSAKHRLNSIKSKFINACAKSQGFKGLMWYITSLRIGVITQDGHTISYLKKIKRDKKIF